MGTVTIWQGAIISFACGAAGALPVVLVFVVIPERARRRRRR